MQPWLVEQMARLGLVRKPSVWEDPEAPEPDEAIVEKIDEASNLMADLDELESPKRDKGLKYAILVSILLHLIFFGVLIPKMVSLPQSKSLLKPGEQVTKMRLVDMPPAPKKEQPPPEKPEAFSDRNNTAKQKRLPKMSVGGPMRQAKPKPPPQKMAMLSPPKAPEFPDEPKEKAKEPKETKEKKKPEVKPKRKAPPSEKARVKEAPEERVARSRSRSLADLMKRRNIDLRPNNQDLSRIFSAQPPGATDYFREGDPDEAVVDINTREDRFASYLLHLKRKIQGVWVYPRSASDQNIEGGLLLEFVLGQNGRLLDVNVLRSSGFNILDDNAVRAVQNAAPYHPLPDWLKAKRLRIRAAFNYVIRRGFMRGML